MLKPAKTFWGWIQHDGLGKLLFNLAIGIIFWSKWAISRYIIYYWFARKYVPTYFENYFLISDRLDGKGIFLELLLKLLFLCVLSNYLRAAFGDPGYVHLMKLEVPRDVSSEKLEKTCIKCDNNWKPPRAHHCKVCARCVLRMDHHCEWIANCVGAKNQKFFILFLFYSILYSLSGIMLSIINLLLWIMEYSNFPKEQAIFSDGWCFVNRVFIGIFGVFFLLFTFDFIWEQGEAVLENQTTVETYKNMVGRPGSALQLMDKVFGTNRWAWLLPITPNIKVNTLELLYYEVEVTGDKKGRELYEEDKFKEMPIYHKYFM